MDFVSFLVADRQENPPKCQSGSQRKCGTRGRQKSLLHKFCFYFWKSFQISGIVFIPVIPSLQSFSLRSSDFNECGP